MFLFLMIFGMENILETHCKQDLFKKGDTQFIALYFSIRFALKIFNRWKN